MSNFSYCSLKMCVCCQGFTLILEEDFKGSSGRIRQSSSVFVFLSCVCGSGNDKQEDGLCETSELREETAAASLSASE